MTAKAKEIKEQLELDDRVIKAEAEIAELKRGLKKQSIEIARLNKITSTDQLLSRLHDISQRMFALTIQDAVSSEVAQYNPKVQGKIFKLRYKDDQFWIDRDDWTIEEWSEYLENIKEASNEISV